MCNVYLQMKHSQLLMKHLQSYFSISPLIKLNFIWYSLVLISHNDKERVIMDRVESMQALSIIIISCLIIYDPVQSMPALSKITACLIIYDPVQSMPTLSIIISCLIIYDLVQSMPTLSITISCLFIYDQV